MSALLRPLRLALVALALTFALPAPAQSFEGLDLGTKKSRSKKKSGASGASTRQKRSRTSPAKDADAPAPAPAAAPQAAQQPAPAPTLEQGLDLTQPEPAKADARRPDPKKGPAPVMSFEAVDVSGKSADRQKLDAAVGLFKQEQYERAAMAAYELTQDPKLAGLHVEAQFVLAKSLYRMGLYHASLGQFSQILARGPDTKFFKSSLEWLFFISRKTKNETVILDEVARYANFEFPDRFRNEFRYLLARYHFVRGRALDRVGQKAEADKSFNEVLRLALSVPRTDGFYARAKYLEGLARFRTASQRGGDMAMRRIDPDFRAAVEAFKEVVRLTRPMGPGAAARPDASLRDLAFMQLARTHYGLQQNRYALFYFTKVGRGAGQWLESLFEASWANYRVGQYEQALGNLITLSSPFFQEEYFPEALILKAVIYYENCRYQESSRILEDFERTYLPVHDELEVLTQRQLEAGAYYEVLADVQRKNRQGGPKKGTDVILERILKLALTDTDLAKTNESILELEGEMDAFGTKGDTFRYSELSKRLLEALKAQRQELVQKAGLMAKGKLETELVALKQLLANGLRIKFETTTKEKDFLEEQLKAGGRTAILKQYRYSVAVEDDQLYWPYEGEYWRDELGTYQYTLTKGCIDRETANRQLSREGGL